MHGRVGWLLPCLFALQVNCLGESPVLWSASNPKWNSFLEFVNDMKAKNNASAKASLYAFSQQAAAVRDTLYVSSRAIECESKSKRWFLMLTDATPTDIRITMENAYKDRVANSNLTGDHFFHWDCRVGFVRKKNPKNLLELATKIAPTGELCAPISLPWACPEFNSDSFRRSAKDWRQFTALPGEFVVVAGVESAPFVLTQYDMDLAQVLRSFGSYPMMSSEGRLTGWSEANQFGVRDWSVADEAGPSTHAFLYLLIGVVNGAVGGVLAGLACSWCMWSRALSPSRF